MAKIPFDKYYTAPIVARWCIEKTKEIIGEENITEWVEPSAGSGSFSHQIEGCKAYDLYPQHDYIEKADFLKLDLGGYKKGRLFIGNPPFGGASGKLIKEFYNKCCKEGDYIAFILPANYHNNYRRFYKFEIVYSCLLKSEYTNVELWTSFVIYKRNPAKNDWREERETQLKDVSFIKLVRSNQKDKKYKTNLEYDYCITTYGEILKESEPYKTAGQYIVKVNNPNLRYKIISFMKWLYKYNKETGILSRKCVSTNSVSSDEIVKLMKICIPEIQ